MISVAAVKRKEEVADGLVSKVKKRLCRLNTHHPEGQGLLQTVSVVKMALLTTPFLNVPFILVLHHESFVFRRKLNCAFFS